MSSSSADTSDIPVRAQGGTQSIEDAGALEICFQALKNKQVIPVRLALLEQLRLPRSACVQYLSAGRQDQDQEEHFEIFREQCKKLYKTGEENVPF